MNIRVEKRLTKEIPSNAIAEAALIPSRGSRRRDRTNLRCPNCGSANWKMVPLVYEQGLSHTTAKSRLLGFALGDVAVGRAITHTDHESELSKRLRPPEKWSYWRVIRWTVLVSFVFLIAYIHRVMGSSTPVSSMGAVVGMFFVAGVALFCLFLVWRHNSFSYPREQGRWSRSFLCQRCGTVTLL
jgi:hypothetical protein